MPKSAANLWRYSYKVCIAVRWYNKDSQCTFGDIVMPMETEDSSRKHDRVLEIYQRLLSGEILVKEQLAEEFHVNPKSIQRDIDSIRDFCSNRSVRGDGKTDVIYDRAAKGYRIVNEKLTTLTNAELFAVVKILMDSRALNKAEMTTLAEKLVEAALPAKEKKAMKELTGNELFHYVEPRHGKDLLEKMWELGKAITEHRIVKIEYKKVGEDITIRLVKPVGIVNSEYYFYLIAYIGDNDKKHPGFPTVFRLDRISKFTVTKDTFDIPYKDRFEEGQFRKRVQFMYTGKLHRAKFVYTGKDIDAILDRLPTAKAVRQPDGSWLVEAEVYGEKGFKQWLDGQGECREMNKGGAKR